MMFSFNRTIVFILLTCLSSVSLTLFSQTPPAGFEVVSCEGEVLYVPDGTESPEQVKAGTSLVAGRFITLESGKAEVKFPSGKQFSIPANTLLILDPKHETLDNACAAAAAIRDRSVLFVTPREGATLPSDKPISLLFGVQMEMLDLSATSGLSVMAIDPSDPAKPREIEVAAIHFGDSPTQKAGILGYRFFRLESSRGLPEGEFDLILKTLADPSGKKIGKSRAISVTKP